MRESRFLPVPDGLDGMRVDAGVSRMLGLSRTVVATLAEEGDVVVVDIGGAMPSGYNSDSTRTYVVGSPSPEAAERMTPEAIGEHLYTKGQPDPDLVIRTSGEQRLSGFLLWQSEKSEYYFCEAYWPDFRRVDFLRALRAYAERERRYGR